MARKNDAKRIRDDADQLLMFALRNMPASDLERISRIRSGRKALGEVLEFTRRLLGTRLTQLIEVTGLVESRRR